MSKSAPKIRGDLQEIFDRRGNALAYLWLTYSAKNRSDEYIASTTRFCHFLLTESDPLAIQVSYRYRFPKSYDPPPRRLDAVVLTKAKTLELRVICSSDKLHLSANARRELETFREVRVAEQLHAPRREFESCEIRLIGLSELLVGNEVRLRNWFRALTWIAQARFHNLSSIRNKLRERLRHRGELSVSDLLESGEPEEQGALWIAAAFEGVSNGAWYADLNFKELGRNTVFSWTPVLPNE